MKTPITWTNSEIDLTILKLELFSGKGERVDGHPQGGVKERNSFSWIFKFNFFSLGWLKIIILR